MSKTMPSYRRLTPEKFRLLRESLGFTGDKMAQLCGAASGRVVRKWEAADNKIPEGVSRFLWVLTGFSGRHRKYIIEHLTEKSHGRG